MKDKLISLFNSLKTKTISLFQRFPITTIYVVIQYVIISLLIQWKYFDTHPKQMFYLGVVAATMYSLIFNSITIQLVTEKLKLSLKQNLLLNLLSIVVTKVLFILFMYKDFMAFNTISEAFTGNLYRVAIYVVICGLLMLVVPFLWDKDNKNWYNFTLHSAGRFVTTMMYNIVLQAGVAIALGALQSFWDIQLFTNQYVLLTVFVFTLFAPLNFLSGLYRLDQNVEVERPGYLTILGKYILTPLVIVYSAILYPYMFSFPFKSEWPSNQSTFIILAMLAMIYAIMYIFWNSKEGDKDYGFFKKFTLIANVISIPTIIFWAYSMWLRIDAFKLTVNRFALMAIILWFLGMSIYLVYTRTKDVRVVIGSFIAILILCFYMPFSAFYFGQKAQISRLKSIASENGILVENKIVVGDKEKVISAESDMKDILVYLDQFHTLNNVKPYLSDDILKKLDIDSYGYSKQFMNRYSYFDNLFFKELLPLSPDVSLENKYVTTIYSGNDLTIPQGYKSYELLTSYNTNMKFNGSTVIYNNEEYEITVDFSNFKMMTQTNLPNGKSMYYGPNTYTTDNSDLLTFKSDNTMLIITNMEAIVKDMKISEIQNISGIIFRK